MKVDTLAGLATPKVSKKKMPAKAPKVGSQKPVPDLAPIRQSRT